MARYVGSSVPLAPRPGQRWRAALFDDTARRASPWVDVPGVEPVTVVVDRPVLRWTVLIVDDDGRIMLYWWSDGEPLLRAGDSWTTPPLVAI